jgi:hypothetical protein
MNDFLTRARARFACHPGGMRMGAFVAIAVGVMAAVASGNHG